MADIFEILRIVDLAEHLAFDDLRETDHRVERRAQLMAHIGEEFRACAQRQLGFHARFLQRVLRQHALMDILDNADIFAGLAILFGMNQEQVPVIFFVGMLQLAAGNGCGALSGVDAASSSFSRSRKSACTRLKNRVPEHRFAVDWPVMVSKLRDR